MSPAEAPETQALAAAPRDEPQCPDVPLPATRRTFPPGPALTAAYLITGKLGLLLAVPPGYASGVFLPAGLAVSAMLIGGRRTLPWSFAGAFLLNAWTGWAIDHKFGANGLAAALVIAAGSTLQAAVGGRALRRVLGYPTPLDTARDLARFLLVSPICCLTSATLSLTGLVALGDVGLPDLVTSWVAWWSGDTLGVLLMLPLIFVLVGEPRALWRARARPVGIPMLLLFGLFVAIFVQVGRWEREQSLFEFRMLSQQAVGQLRSRFAEQEVFLEQLQRSFIGHAPVLRSDFSSLVQNLLRRFPTISGGRVGATRRAVASGGVRGGAARRGAGVFHPQIGRIGKAAAGRRSCALFPGHLR